MARPSKPSGKKQPAAFNEEALLELTAKIGQSLKGKKRTGRPADHEADGNPETNRPAKRQKSKENGSAPRAARQENGTVPKAKKHRESKSKNISSAELLEEIKALGGDEEDLELIANVDSDAEDGGAETYEPPPGSQVDEGFKNELAKFASGLGFEHVQPDDDSATSEEEDAESGRDEAEEPAKVQAEEPAKVLAERREERLKRGNLTVEARPDWHAISLEPLPNAGSKDVGRFSSTIERIRLHARELLDQEAAAYSTAQSKSSSRKFMSTIMSSGTQSDKVSALTLAIQESPVHNIKAFESLIGLAGKNNRGQAIGALGALVDMLGNGSVLPGDRRLRAFHMQSGLLGYLQELKLAAWQPGQDLPQPLTDAHLILWCFEDWLKDAYFRIIQLLERWSGDEIEYSRSTTLDYIFGLLRDKPEQEANLLRLLVNKLGDRDRKIASRSSYLLLQLLILHPGMKEVVITAVEQEILLRPGQSLRTKYYAVTTLNQTILSGKEPSIAENLLRIYFEIFVTLLKSGALTAPSGGQAEGQKHQPRRRKDNRKAPEEKVGVEPEIAQKLVSAVLTGVNRAVPFANADNPTLESHLDTLFKITHSSNLNTGVQALMLIQQLAMSKHLAVDRFYRTLYESLLDPRLIESSKQALYLNLLFRALKNDVDVRRVKAFVKRMLQVVNLHQASFACGVLYLIAELEKTFPDLKTLVQEPEDVDGDEEEVFKDVVENGSTPADASRDVDEAQERRPVAYDGRKRAPEYSNADQSCLWELVPFFRHFHPSVSVFAANVITRQSSLPKPELANHTLIHFLDKFVYRNPKSTETKRGGSIMQPVLAGGISVQAVVPGKTGSKRQPLVNNATFWNLKQDQVAAEDVFFHEYFAQVGKPGRVVAKAAKKRRDGDGEGEGEDGLSGDEDAEEEIWQALVSSRPDMEGADGESDADMDMDDLEEDGSDVDLDGLSDSADGSDLDDVDLDDSEADLESFSDSGTDESDADVEGSKVTELVPGKSNGRLSRKELKSLPTFASADDYAAMLADDEDVLAGL